MPRSNPNSPWLRSRLGILSLAVAASVSIPGCAGIRNGHLAPVTTKTPDGFTISDTAHMRMGLRWDFDKALEALRSGDYESAIELFLPITESDPDFAAPHIDLAIAYRETDRYDDAESALRRALEVSPGHPVALNELGIVYRRVGRFEEARAAYEAALALHPRFHYARKNLAIVCDLFLADTDCALENYEIYHRAVPEDGEVAIWIADLENRAEK